MKTIVVLVCVINILLYALSCNTNSMSTSQKNRLVDDECVYLTSTPLCIIDHSLTVDEHSEISAFTDDNEDNDIRNIMNIINDRVLWIIEHRGSPRQNSNEGRFCGTLTFIDNDVYQDYYDGSTLVYREGGVEYYDKLEGAVMFDLYYDNEERLVYAEITQYRYHTYSIYFFDEKILFLIVGSNHDEEGWRCLKENELDEYMKNAVNLCLENAYNLLRVKSTMP